MALSKNQKDIVNLAASGGTDKEFLVMQRIHEMEDTFDTKIEELNTTLKGDQGEPGEDGHTPTDEELLTLIEQVMPEVEDGHTPTDEELLTLIKPLIPKVKDGETPSDARLLSLIRPLIPDQEKMMVEIETSLAEKLPALGQRIRDGLELLPEGEKLNPQAIEGWTEFEQGIRDAIAKSGGKIGWGAHPLTVHSSGTPVDKNTRNINFTGSGVSSVTRSKNGVVTVTLSGGSGGSGTVTSVASADGSITVTNPTTTADLAVVKSPKLSTGRTIAITGDLSYTSPSFDGSGNVTAAGTLATVNTDVGTFTNATITVNGKGLITAASTGAGGGSGITRSINSISADTTAGATAAVDYVYLMTGSHTLTLPTAVGNTNQYSAKAVSGTTTVGTTSAQTINGSSTVTILTGSVLTFISDNANWHVI